MQWIPLTISGRTTLFKNLYVTYNSTWDPYYKNSDGVRTSQTELKVNNRMFRMTQSDWNFSLNWTLNPDALNAKNTQAQNTDPNKPNSLNAPNFSIPWNLNFSYTLYYLKQEEGIPDKYTNSTIQTLSVTGEVNLSSKWKISASSGYDFKNKELSYTSIDIYRDLHCWEMRFNWIPIGPRTSWNFTINVKASVLQDLKYLKKKDFRDAL
jgi:predicted porin